MSLWLERFNELERYGSMLREGDQNRLFRQSQREQHALPAFCKSMCWLGTCLSAWGDRLQHRYGTAVESKNLAGKRSVG